MPVTGPSTVTPRAGYAIIDDYGNLEHRRVPYDHGASAAAVRERFGDATWTETIAARIARAGSWTLSREER